VCHNIVSLHWYEVVNAKWQVNNIIISLIIILYSIDINFESCLLYWSWDSGDLHINVSGWGWWLMVVVDDAWSRFHQNFDFNASKSMSSQLLIWKSLLVFNLFWSIPLFAATTNFYPLFAALSGAKAIKITLDNFLSPSSHSISNTHHLLLIHKLVNWCLSNLPWCSCLYTIFKIIKCFISFANFFNFHSWTIIVWCYNYVSTLPSHC